MTDERNAAAFMKHRANEILKKLQIG